MSHSTTFAGPLPPPEALQKFEAVLPGLADRITTMAEGYARDTWANNRATRILALGAPVLAFIVAMTTILGGFYLIYSGKSPEGMATVITAVVGLVGAFVYGKRQLAKT